MQTIDTGYTSCINTFTATYTHTQAQLLLFQIAGSIIPRMAKATDVNFSIYLVASFKLLPSIESQLISGTDGNLSGATLTIATLAWLSFIMMFTNKV